LVAFGSPNPFPSEAQDVGFRLSGFAAIITVGSVALNLHSNVPDVIQPAQNKKTVAKLIGAAQATALLFYILIGSLCGMYFGDSVDPLVTLNWRNYTGGFGLLSLCLNQLIPWNLL